MLTLIQAIRLLDIQDYEIIAFSTTSEFWSAPEFSVSDIKKYFDMKHTQVTKITTHRRVYDSDINWGFVVDEKTFDQARKIQTKQLKQFICKIHSEFLVGDEVKELNQEREAYENNSEKINNGRIK